MVQVRINGHFYRQLAIPYETAEHVSIRLAPSILEWFPDVQRRV